jgi:hypothetical protein
MTRLIQLKKGNIRRVALVEEPTIQLLDGCSSIYELAHTAISAGMKLSDLARQRARHEAVLYEPVYRGESDWKLLPAVDHPEEPARCLISGTGLTHLGSARNRQSMHATSDEQLSDSMKMFRWGVEGGRPVAGLIGTPPEWFYKGTGSILRAHGEALDIPSYAGDGGEEAEIAGVYVIGPDGQPYRLGLAVGNEFSDHKFEKKNYLNLAGSKLRACSIGPELVLDPDFQSVLVAVMVERHGVAVWSKTFRSGDSEMSHSLENIEHHHFKYGAHRRSGDVHVHFFGTDCLSFSDDIHLEDGDVVQISVEGYGRPLRNVILADRTSPARVSVIALG